MDLWQLHIFCKVVELKSFSRAGDAVRLSQPTISSHIKDLEEHFGLRLIDRLARRVEPTKAGQLLYKHARKILALRDETETALADFQGSVKGQLVIGGSTIPSGYLLPPIIGNFCKAYPDVKITLLVGDTGEVLQKVLDLDVELGIVGARAENRQLKQVALVKDEMRLVVPCGHKWFGQKSIRLEQLLDEPLIVREPGSGTLRSFEKSLDRQGYRLEDFNIIARMGSTLAVCQAIKSKVGVSVLSSLAVHQDVAEGRLWPLEIEKLHLERQFYLTTMANRTQSPLVRPFINFLFESFNNPMDDSTTMEE